MSSEEEVVIREDNDDSRLDYYSKVDLLGEDDDVYEQLEHLTAPRSTSPPSKEDNECLPQPATTNLATNHELPTRSGSSYRGVSADLLEMLDEGSRSRLDHNMGTELMPADIDFVRSTPLFDFWDEGVFQNMIEEDLITFRRFNKKDVIATEEDCKENIIIVKSGELFIWVLVKREDITKYQQSLEKYSSSRDFADTNFESAKNKHVKGEIANLMYDHIPVSSRFRKFEKERRQQNKLLNVSVKSTSPPPAETNKNDEAEDNVTIVTGHLNSDDFDPRVSLVRPKSVKFMPVTPKPASYIIKPMSAKTPLRANLTVLRNRPSTVLSRIMSDSNLNTSVAGRNAEERFNRFSQSGYSSRGQDLGSGRGDLDPIFTGRFGVDEAADTQQGKKQKPEDLALNKFKTRYPEVWYENFKSDPTRIESLFLKFTKLNAGEMFGLNEYVFDEERESDRMIGIPAHVNLIRSHKIKMHLKSNELEEAELEANNRYNMVASSKQVECYFVNKLGYLKHMYSLTSDKREAGKFIDRLKQIFVQVQSGRQINEQFFNNLSWNLYKKRMYGQHMDRVEAIRSAGKLRKSERPKTGLEKGPRISQMVAKTHFPAPGEYGATTTTTSNTLIINSATPIQRPLSTYGNLKSRKFSNISNLVKKNQA